MAVQEDDVYEITDSPATSDLTEPEEEKETKPSRSRSGEHTRQRRISRAEHPTQKHHRRTSTGMAVRGGDDGSVYEIPDSEEEQEAERERENDRNLRKAIEMSKQSHTDEPAQKQHRTITQKDDIVEIPDERNERKLRKASETEQRALDVTLKTFDFNSSARAMAAATTNPTVASSSSSSSARQNTTKVLKRKQFVSLVSDEEDDEKLKRPETQKQQQVSKKPRTRKDSPEALQPVQKSSGIMDRGALIEARLAKYQATGTTNSRSASANGGGNGSREGSNDGVPPQSFYGSGNIIGGNYVDSLKVVPSVPSPIPVQDTATEDRIPLVDLEEVKPTTLKQTSAALTPATDPPTTAKDGWYPTGVVKKTWLENQNNGSDTIQIEGVLQKETLVTTLLSSFQWDYEWIMGHLPLHRKDHNMVFVMQGKEEADRQMTQAIFGGLARIELVFPPMDGQVNCMHSKLMLLFHKKGDREWLRIAIPTANLTNYDWGLMTGVMENMVFLIDLPKLESPNLEQTFFLEELLYFCSEQNIPLSVINELVSYDFSETKQMAFVHTIGGSHGGEAWKRTGYCGLGTAVKKLGYHSGKGLEVDYVTSSLGAAKEEFISNIYRAAQGHNGSAELQRRNKKPIKVPPPKRSAKTFFTKVRAATTNAEEESTDDDSNFEEETKWNTIKEKFRVFFPSKDTVVASKGGVGCGGTICFQRKWWNDQTFPKALVRDCKSVRPGALMHNKLLFARPGKSLNSKNGQMAAWAYVGSANLSESAWGKLVVDRSTMSPKLNCKNWECGVLLPVPAMVLGRTLSGTPEQKGPIDIHAFEKTVPVPMETPGEKLEGRQPWFFMEQ